MTPTYPTQEAAANTGSVPGGTTSDTDTTSSSTLNLRRRVKSTVLHEMNPGPIRPSPRPSTQHTIVSQDTQSNIGRIRDKRALFPPTIAVSQTKGLRARVMIRTRQQTKRNNRGDNDILLYSAHSPYAVVEDSAIVDMLLQLAEKLHFLDLGFAEYFTHVVDNDPAYARSQLQDIRLCLFKAQNPSSPELSLDENPDVNLGDLGYFCEDVLQAHSEARPHKTPGGPKFHVTRRNIRDNLSYLQDSLEAPYWRYILGEVGQWRANATGLMDRAVMRVIYSAKLELKVAVAKIKHQGEMKGLSDNIAPIVKGIEQRIRLLDDVRDSSLDGIQDVDEILQESQYLPGYHAEQAPSANLPAVSDVAPGMHQPRITITVTSMVAVLVFLAFAMPFLAIGFSKAQAKGEVGSARDADFWFLLKDTVMSMMGSVLVVIALRRGPWFSLVYLYVYLMLGAGLVFSIVSIVLFSYAHSGWSNMFGMFGAMSSTWAALIMTQAGAGQDWQKAGKVKAE